MIKVLLDKGYLLEFIFFTIKTRLKYYAYKVIKEGEDRNNSNSNKTSYFIIPYGGHTISEGFLTITKKFDYKLAF